MGNSKSSETIKNSINDQNLQQFEEQECLSFLVIGDYGYGSKGQKVAAQQMDIIGLKENAQFVIGTGDNFYKPNGVKDVDDVNWDLKWASIYQTKPYLGKLTWYQTLGNHDYGSKNVKAQFEYRKNGWRMDDFFWSHTKQIKNTKIAFIHIDTNYLAYGKKGQKSKKYMGWHFKQLGWNNKNQMLKIIDQQLEQFKDYDWKIVIGHHPVGNTHYDQKHTSMLQQYFKHHQVDLYISGHAHHLAYDNTEDMGYLLSGAGGQAKQIKFKSLIYKIKGLNPIWSKDGVFGFVNIKISENSIQIIPHYIKGKNIKNTEKWRSYQLPIQQKRQQKREKEDQQQQIQ